jgi:SAM-dependent methyltransferase
MADSDSQWKAWGKADPYFGVWTDERFRAANIEDNREAFFSTGERNIGIFLERAQKYFGPVAAGRALDFGCGVGRLTLPLAQQFSSVVGVDISDDMLGEARRNCAGRGITNAEFVLSDDELSRVQGRFDLVLSYIVLQHLPVERGMKVADRLLGLVAPGGIAILQFSVKRRESRIRKLKYWVSHNMPQVLAVSRFLTGKGWSPLSMRMSEYEISDVLALFAKHGMRDVLVSEHFQDVYPAFHFTARKPG